MEWDITFFFFFFLLLPMSINNVLRLILHRKERHYFLFLVQPHFSLLPINLNQSWGLKSLFFLLLLLCYLLTCWMMNYIAEDQEGRKKNALLSENKNCCVARFLRTARPSFPHVHLPRLFSSGSSRWPRQTTDPPESRCNWLWNLTELKRLPTRLFHSNRKWVSFAGR